MGEEEDTSPSPAGSDAGQAARVDRIERNAAGQLVVHLDGGDGPVVDVELARYFPWSVPEAYVSIRGTDGRDSSLADRHGLHDRILAVHRDDVAVEVDALGAIRVRRRARRGRIRRSVGRHIFGAAEGQ